MPRERGVGETGGVASLGVGETETLAIEDQFRVIDEGHAVGVGEVLGALADEVDVGAFLEDETRGVDGIAEALDAGDASGFHATAVHEERIELDASVGREEAAIASVEGGIVFKDGNSGFDGIEGGAAPGKDFVTELERVADSCFMVRSSVRGDGPGSAVNEEGGVVRGWLGRHREHRSAWGRRKLCAVRRRGRRCEGAGWCQEARGM